jgi:hypothetical protein
LVECREHIFGWGAALGLPIFCPYYSLRTLSYMA